MEVTNDYRIQYSIEENVKKLQGVNCWMFLEFFNSRFDLYVDRVTKMWEIKCYDKMFGFEFFEVKCLF